MPGSLPGAGDIEVLLGKCRHNKAIRALWWDSLMKAEMGTYSRGTKPECGEPEKFPERGDF